MAELKQAAFSASLNTSKNGGIEQNTTGKLKDHKQVAITPTLLQTVHTRASLLSLAKNTSGIVAKVAIKPAINAGLQAAQKTIPIQRSKKSTLKDAQTKQQSTETQKAAQIALMDHLYCCCRASDDHEKRYNQKSEEQTTPKTVNKPRLEKTKNVINLSETPQHRRVTRSLSGALPKKHTRDEAFMSTSNAARQHSTGNSAQKTQTVINTAKLAKNMFDAKLKNQHLENNETYKSTDNDYGSKNQTDDSNKQTPTSSSNSNLNAENTTNFNIMVELNLNVNTLNNPNTADHINLPKSNETSKSKTYTTTTFNETTRSNSTIFISSANKTLNKNQFNVTTEKSTSNEVTKNCQTSVSDQRSSSAPYIPLRTHKSSEINSNNKFTNSFATSSTISLSSEDSDSSDDSVSLVTSTKNTTNNTQPMTFEQSAANKPMADCNDSDTESNSSNSELYFDFAAVDSALLNSDDDDEDSPNSKFFNKLCNIPLPNRNEIFRRLNSVCCPSNRDPHFFYKQNERALEHVFESLNKAPTENELAEDPEGLAVSLMQHQRHALAWLEFCEKRRPFGGLLADDMGLGKTITMLSLVMAEKNRLESGEDETDWSESGGGTLVICPASLLRQWENEVNTKFSFVLMPLVFHGNVHKNDIDRLRSFDIVITTYDTIVNGRLAKYLFHIKWRRIILDEAHIVRNPATQKSMMVCELRATFRWALTGTPIQNKEMDIFAILKFLRYAPFDDVTFWRSWSHDHQRLSVVLRSIMLRRTKLELQKQNIFFELPARTEKTLIIQLSEGETNVHAAIMSFSKVLVQKFILQREERKADATLGVDNYLRRLEQERKIAPASRDYEEFLQKLSCDASYIQTHVILVLILRLTQICCHPALAEAMIFDDESIHFNASSDSSFGTDNSNEPPQKKLKVENDLSVREILSRNNPVFERGNPSSKMLEVMKILQQNVLRTSDKAVIVSQWTGYLEIVGNFLNSEGIAAMPFNGKMTLEEREDTLGRFNCRSSDVKILLLSLKCGGVGLNLTAANHLILLDIHWNPQIEVQAQDRIYRLGQKKPVYIYKFLCHETIEERIKMVQDDKLKLADNLLTGASALRNGLRFSVRELKKLFGID